MQFYEGLLFSFTNSMKIDRGSNYTWPYDLTALVRLSNKYHLLMGLSNCCQKRDRLV